MVIGKDKFKHAGGCFAIVAVVGGLAGAVMPAPAAAVIGFLAAAAIGAGKEEKDGDGSGTKDPNDMLANVAGALAGAAAVWAGWGAV